MKGIILAGGSGTRLRPLTDVVNKHLLPVGYQPMIYWPLKFLVANDITDILIVVGGQSTGDILHQIGSGSSFGARVTYAYQHGNGGIADALKLAEPFAEDEDKFAVVLGDNIYFDLKLPRHYGRGATVFLSECDNPELFGVAVIQDGAITHIIEKPDTFISNLAVTGLYIYDQSVWEYLDALRPSGRGELEITHLNNAYAADGLLDYSVISGQWIDAGTPELYHKANLWALEREN